MVVVSILWTNLVISDLIFQVPPVVLLRIPKIKLPKCSNTFKIKSTTNLTVTPLDFSAANCWIPVFQYSQCISPTNSYWINTSNMESKCTRKADFINKNTYKMAMENKWFAQGLIGLSRSFLTFSIGLGHLILEPSHLA